MGVLILGEKGDVVEDHRHSFEMFKLTVNIISLVVVG